MEYQTLGEWIWNCFKIGFRITSLTLELPLGFLGPQHDIKIETMSFIHMVVNRVFWTFSNSCTVNNGVLRYTFAMVFGTLSYVLV